ncbi:uncharacterized protein JN550_005405 [Neoarthrinium moseri]|uniref:uncharacterized protein n=1 Tax=Neoarthrinium moseri TaxID=1658444 RepID=UPI001FDAE003|nr:uncharacterized protein JN550_005405 [Neoarthrinium moseri]KAI1870477.1 hypothetical protein JN550_005405 [Neoarthrinium moseri]
MPDADPDATSVMAPGSMTGTLLDVLQDHVTRSLAEQLTKEFMNSPDFQHLRHPVIHIEARLEERSSKTEREETPHDLLFSHSVDLSEISQQQSSSSQYYNASPFGGGIISHEQQQVAGIILPDDQVLEQSDMQGASGPISPMSLRSSPADSDYESDTSTPTPPVPDNMGRQGLGGLRPARALSIPTETEGTSGRQIQSGDKFPKRRAMKPPGHSLQPSTLDKLIIGIWEQIYRNVNLEPQGYLDFLHVEAPHPSYGGTVLDMGHVRHGNQYIAQPAAGGSFNRMNTLCRQVTQASRTCRSLEIVVQARWVEYFNEYVDSCALTNPIVPRTKHNKAALSEACFDFGWTEKELRNKMYIWRGYKDIKDAGGWAALVFSGMGIYRFSKYRIGFGEDSMQRLRTLRPLFEVAADTLHPGWRYLLGVVGESTQQVYTEHPHDWVVFLDGSPPVPLQTTYMQWDPDFSYRQVDESIVDQTAWGCDDPRWTPPLDAIIRGAAMPLCEVCGKQQSDDPIQNSCYCFPTLFGCAKTSPSPVLIYHTPNGRNNGVIALCPFERGSPVGEFVGLITKGFQDVDVLESSTRLEKYQIWQGQQGNFTRFVNHSCKANAQYQRFTWLNTQRIILVSKGIEAGAEVTVDYSDKYWRGLDKKCLCGEACCKYK